MSKNQKLFQSRSQIEELIKNADDSSKTKELISEFKELQKKRVPFFLTLEELDKIFRWKLRGQYGRQLKIRDRNTDNNIKVITQSAFLISHRDNNYETELKLKLLTTISGVEIPVASAILTLCYPELYSVIDFRNWRQIMDKEPTTTYTVNNYIAYLEKIRELANEYRFTPQEIDLAVWQLDKEVVR